MNMYYFLCALFFCSALNSMESPKSEVSKNTDGVFTRTIDDEKIELLSPQGDVALRFSPSVKKQVLCSIAANKFKKRYEFEDPIEERFLSGLHAAFSPSGALFAAVLKEPFTFKDCRIVVINCKNGKVLTQEELLPLGRSHMPESWSHCSSLHFITDTQLCIVSGDELALNQSLKSKESSSAINTLWMYDIVFSDKSTVDLVPSGKVCLSMLSKGSLTIRALTALQDGAIAFVSDQSVFCVKEYDNEGNKLDKPELRHEINTKLSLIVPSDNEDEKNEWIHHVTQSTKERFADGHVSLISVPNAQVLLLALCDGRTRNVRVHSAKNGEHIRTISLNGPIIQMFSGTDSGHCAFITKVAQLGAFTGTQVLSFWDFLQSQEGELVYYEQIAKRNEEARIMAWSNDALFVNRKNQGGKTLRAVTQGSGDTSRTGLFKMTDVLTMIKHKKKQGCSPLSASIFGLRSSVNERVGTL